MKIAMDLKGPKGEMWDLKMTYKGLSPTDTLDIVSAARAYASLIDGTKGEARETHGIDASQAKGYTLGFEYSADDLPGGMEDLYKAKVEASDLLYSQMIELQGAGIKLLERLRESGVIEVKSGQRQ